MSNLLTDVIAIVATATPDGTVHIQHGPCLEGEDGVWILTPDRGFVATFPTRMDVSTGKAIETRGVAVRYWHPKMTRDGEPVTLAELNREASAAAIASL